jgi:hypothetical protein
MRGASASDAKEARMGRGLRNAAVAKKYDWPTSPQIRQ